MIPVVVLSTHIMGLAVIRSLGKIGIPVTVVYYQKEDMGYVSRYVKEKIFVPHPEKNEEEFISLLLEYAERKGQRLLIPADDATLSAVSRHKTLLKNYYIIACTDWEITRQFIEKNITYKIADTIGVPSPRTFVPNSIEELEGIGEAIGYPCVVKPCKSHSYYEIFKKKMVKVHNLDQMLSAYKQAVDAGLEVMAQEYIPGDDTNGVNYNSYFWNGKPLIEFTSEKVRLSPPGFGVPSVVISKDINRVIESGRKILQAIGYYGYSCTEFKKDIRDGKYKLMEINGRHNRSALLSIRCGINFPLIEYNHLVKGELPSAQDYKKDIYWIDEFRDIIYSFKYLKEQSLIKYMKPYLKPNIFAVFDRKDIKPFIKRCADIFKMGCKSVFSKKTQ